MVHLRHVIDCALRVLGRLSGVYANCDGSCRRSCGDVHAPCRAAERNSFIVLATLLRSLDVSETE